MKTPRLKVQTYRLSWDETIRDGRAGIPPAARGLAAPRPIFEHVRTDFAAWTVHRFRIGSVLVVVRYRKGV